MKNRWIWPAIIGLGIVGFAVSGWVLFEVIPARQTRERLAEVKRMEQLQRASMPSSIPPRFPRGAMPPGMPDMPEGLRPGPPPTLAQRKRFTPDVSVQNAAMSPDGKFIALVGTRNFAAGEPVSVVVLASTSGKILVRRRQEERPELQWGQASEPGRLDIDGTPHFLKKTGKTWKLGVAGTSVQKSPPSWVVARYPYPAIQAILPESDVAVWYLNDGKTGRGDLVASSLSDESEVWLPASISKDRNSGTTAFVAPRFQSGAPRRLAALFRRDIMTKKRELEVWDLSRHAPIFRRTFGADVGEMAWTRDGRSLIVTGLPRPQKRGGDDVSNGVDIYDATTGKQRVALTLDGLDSDFSVSDDGRYFLTVENTWKGKTGTGRLAIRSTSDGQIVSRFERPRRIEAEPKFAPGSVPRLIWSSKDTVFVQPWRISKTALKLKPRQLKIELD